MIGPVLQWTVGQSLNAPPFCLEIKQLKYALVIVGSLSENLIHIIHIWAFCGPKKGHPGSVFNTEHPKH